MQPGPNGTSLFAEISSHVQHHKKLIALMNILTIDIFPRWYLMAEYSDGSVQSLFSLAMKVGRVRMYHNKGDRKQITVKMNYLGTWLWVTVHPGRRNPPQNKLFIWNKNWSLVKSPQSCFSFFFFFSWDTLLLQSKAPSSGSACVRLPKHLQSDQ